MIITTIFSLPIICLGIFLDYKLTKKVDLFYILVIAFSLLPLANIAIAFIILTEIIPDIKKSMMEKKFKKDHPELEVLNMLNEIYKIVKSNSSMGVDLDLRMKSVMPILKEKHHKPHYSQFLCLNEITFARILSIIQENLKVDTERISTLKVMSLATDSLEIFLDEFEFLEEQETKNVKDEREIICNRHIEELQEEIEYQKTKRISIQ